MRRPAVAGSGRDGDEHDGAERRQADDPSERMPCADGCPPRICRNRRAAVCNRGETRSSVGWQGWHRHAAERTRQAACHYPSADGRADRFQSPKGVLGRAAVRRRLVQARTPRAAHALWPERRRQDDAAPRPDGRDLAPGRRARVREGHAHRAPRPAPAARVGRHAPRVRALRSGRPRGARRGAATPRDGDGEWRPRSGDDAALQRRTGTPGARGRLPLARPRRCSRARPRLRGRRPRSPTRDVLRRRADTSVAGARPCRRSRPAPPRRAHQPPRHGVDRVARDGARLAGHGDRARRARPLVPRGGLDGGARARQTAVRPSSPVRGTPGARSGRRAP